MKLKFLKLVLPCLASLACLTGCGSDPNDIDFSKDSYQGTYYNGYDLKLKGSALQSELQRLMFDTHSVFVTYKDYKTYASFTGGHISSEAAPEEVETLKRNEYFYTGKRATGVGTREHVWPCANSAGLWVHDEGTVHYVDGNNYRGGGSDLYHVRPSTSSVNTARGNSTFVDFDDSEFAGIKSEVIEVGDGGPYKLKIQGYDSAKQFAKKAEPADEFKGDIARILVYVWVHYSYCGKYYNQKDMIGNLSLTSVMGYGPNQRRVYEKLKAWNEEDPPSEIEMLRNNTVEKIQGNRNPFVDHPTLMRTLLR